MIFRATPQWFISMSHGELRDKALAAIRAVAWLPQWGEARIEGMVANRPDWCISRQRSWGVPIALFADKDSGEPHPDTPALIEAVAQRVEQGGIDAWFDLDPGELLGAEAGGYEKVTDTLDVWFDSGVTHYFVLQQDPSLAFPADMYLEGSDQYRGWFQSSLLTAVAMHGHAPYKSVLTHGFTVDAHGRKMSKSLGNVVSPQQVLKTMGADILRLWVASADYRGEMSVSDEILTRIADAYRRIRNTARFLLANLHGFDPAAHLVPPREMLALDRWAVARAREIQRQLFEAYNAYEFHLVYQRVHNFCTNDMGGFYLDIIKDRQYTTQRDSLRAALRPDGHVSPHRGHGALARPGAELYRRGDLAPPARRAGRVGIPGDLVRAAAPGHYPGGGGRRHGRGFWDRVIAVRRAVDKELEKLRAAGDIGAALEAEVDLYCGRRALPVPGAPGATSCALS